MGTPMRQYAEHLFADPVAICDMNEARARDCRQIWNP